MAKAGFNVTDGSQSITKTILLLTWPVFLEQVLTTLVSYADTAMVGALGAGATAAVTISNSPIFLLNGVIMALGVGLTALVSQAVGAGDSEMVKKLMRHAMLVIIFVGSPICIANILLHRLIPLWMGADPEILDTAAQYNLIVATGRIFSFAAVIVNAVLRGYGDTKTPLIVNTLMNVINVIGNYLLINPTRVITVFGTSFTMPGAGWGVAGAAAATAIGTAVSGILAVTIAFTRKNEYKISFKDSFKPDISLLKKLFGISFPAMLERIFMSSSGIFVNSSIATLGTANIAANSLCLTAESLSYMPAFSFQTATTTLVGQSLGAGKPDLAEKFVKKSMLLGIILMAFTGAGLFFFATPIIGVFTPDEEVIELAARCLQIVAFIQIPQAMVWIYAGALRGAGDTKYSFYITASTNWLVRTLWSILCIRVFHLGLESVQYCMLAEIFARLALMFLRYRSGKWKNIASSVKTEKLSA